DLGMDGHERLIRRLDVPDLEAEALRIGERQAVAFAGHLDALALQALLPERHGVGRADPPYNRMHHPPARAPAAGTRILEEGDVGAGARGLVGVEQVVDRGVVLVHGLLHQAQPEDARVEVDVPGRVAGDRRHVVDAFQLHGCCSSRSRSYYAFVSGR